MKIILTGGGTAGHVIPHVALLNDIKKNFDFIVYIGSRNGIEKEIISNENITYYEITTTKFVRQKLLKNLSIPFKLIKGIHDAKKIIKQEKPNVIFSKGGYVSLPVVVAAKLYKIPVIAHESDLKIGLANKLSKPCVNIICTTFEKTANCLSKKGVFTGSPMRLDMNKNKQDSLIKLGIRTNKPILLVTGGSLGSKNINKKIRDELCEILKKFYVIHLTGKGNIEKNLLNIKDYKQIEFTNDMGTIISCADVIVSRAGSNTIFELAVLRKPMLLIPLPKGNSRGDQVDNAKYFNQLGYANFVTEEQLQTSRIFPHILQTYNDSNILIRNLEKANIQPGNKTIIETILNYSKK